MKKAPNTKAKKKSTKKVLHKAKHLGRPRFAVNAETRRRVEQMVMCKMEKEDIARALGCSGPTLRLHFAEELKEGAQRKLEEVINLLFIAARKGNISAQRKLVAMGGVVDVNASKFNPNKYEDGELSEEDRPLHNKKFSKKLGKKERQQLEAEEHDETFSAPQPPKLIVNNK